MQPNSPRATSSACSRSSAPLTSWSPAVPYGLEDILGKAGYLAVRCSSSLVHPTHLERPHLASWSASSPPPSPPKAAYYCLGLSPGPRALSGAFRKPGSRMAASVFDMAIYPVTLRPLSHAKLAPSLDQPARSRHRLGSSPSSSSASLWNLKRAHPSVGEGSVAMFCRPASRPFVSPRRDRLSGTGTSIGGGATALRRNPLAAHRPQPAAISRHPLELYGLG